MKKIFVLICSLTILGLSSAKAQKVWSLEECINYALENNLTVKRQELNVQYNKNNYTQSYFNMLPDINGRISESFTSGKAFDYYATPPTYRDQESWTGNLGLNSSVTIFGGLQIINGIQKAKYDFLKSQSDLNVAKNGMQLDLAAAYLDVLFAQELLQVAKSKLEVTALQVERSKKLMEVGNIAQGDYLQIKAQESNDRTSMINAQNRLSFTYLVITQLLDLDSVGSFDIVIPQNIEVELLTLPESVQSIYVKALEYMPEVKSAEYGVKSAEKTHSIAWGQISPTISLNGGLSTFYSTENINQESPTSNYSIREQFKDGYNKQATLGVSIPIFNRLQVKNSISNTKIQVDDSKYQLELVKQALYKSVQQAHANALASQEKFYSSVEAVNYNQEAFKYTSQKMEVGLVNSVDYNIAQNNLVNAQSSMLQAKYEYIFKLKILDLYMGKSISL